MRLACLLYLCISLFETPDFRALESLPSQDRGGPKPKDWLALTEQRLGKVWYELLIEIVCVLAFAADLRIQVRCMSAGCGR